LARAGALEDFIDVVDDIVGIAQYIAQRQEADVVQVF
jgi:peroxiredoxin family protein